MEVNPSAYLGYLFTTNKPPFKMIYYITINTKGFYERPTHLLTLVNSSNIHWLERCCKFARLESCGVADG